MEYQYQSPWFVEALQKEGNLEVNQLDVNLNTDVDADIHADVHERTKLHTDTKTYT